MNDIRYLNYGKFLVLRLQLFIFYFSSFRETLRSLPRIADQMKYMKMTHVI